MPTYEYRCEANGHRLEVVQRITDDPLTECPECGGQLRRVFHPVGVVLKGSGFYATDSRSKGSLKPGKAGESKTESAPAKSEKKSADKPSSSSSKGSDA